MMVKFSRLLHPNELIPRSFLYRVRQLGSEMQKNRLFQFSKPIFETKSQIILESLADA